VLGCTCFCGAIRTLGALYSAPHQRTSPLPPSCNTPTTWAPRHPVSCHQYAYSAACSCHCAPTPPSLKQSSPPPSHHLCHLCR
jgi:hypothetical protein